MKVSKKKFKRLKKDAKGGSDWLNSYQKIEDFLLEELGQDFVTRYKTPEENVIVSIQLLVLRRGLWGN